ncbi:unnamed protein product [Cyprideis torosa]|uniref:Uncharacterized protein n=1 Tax=Cyprideis torosa TaxID=163714 RepID=A0A7R8WI77_9CRUS|nr:unnamed protein product [Cyprideis torosa]CAG0900362.1 unnamed protein product [Cyprideis torosa]
MASRTTSEILLELEIDVLECPGVRLAEKESCYLRVFLFDSDVKTRQLSAYFPMILKERFRFMKKFYSLRNWNELEVKLRLEPFSVELLQRRVGRHSRVLALSARPDPGRREKQEEGEGKVGGEISSSPSLDQEYQGSAWDLMVACHHGYDPLFPPATSEGRVRLVMRPTRGLGSLLNPELHTNVWMSAAGWDSTWRQTFGTRLNGPPASLSKSVAEATPPMVSYVDEKGGPMRAAGLSVEIDVQKICCKRLRYVPQGKLFIQVTYLDQSASTSPSYPIFPVLFHETLVFRQVLEGVSRVSTAGHHLSQSIMRIDFKELTLDPPLLAYVELNGWEVLSPVEKDLYEEVEENIQIKMVPNGPFLHNEPPTLHLVTRATIDPIYSRERIHAAQPFSSPPRSGRPDSGIDSNCRNLTYRKSSSRRCPSASSAVHVRPPFVVRRVPSDIFRSAVPKSPVSHRSRSRSGRSGDGSSSRRRSHSCDACTSRTGRRRNTSMVRSRSVEEIRRQRLGLRGKCLKMKGNPSWFSSRHECPKQILHKREVCRICTLYEDYFGEVYPGHRKRSATVVQKLTPDVSPDSSSDTPDADMRNGDEKGMGIRKSSSDSSIDSYRLY